MQKKRADNEKNINYKNLITQYYDKDPQLSDASHLIRPITPQIQVLRYLNDFEKKVDGLIKTKRYDIQQAFMKPPQKMKRLLRIQANRQRVGDQIYVKVFGSIYPSKQGSQALKFTNFFRQITFTYANQSQPTQIWRKPTSNFVQRDGIAVKILRKDQGNITIQLTPIMNPPKYQIDPVLQKIVGMKKGTRIQVLEAFWLYVKNLKLQDSENKQIINADDALRNIFKLDKIAFATVNNRIRQLLSLCEPYTIQLSTSQTIKVFDVVVQIEQRPNVDIVPFFTQKLNEQRSDHPFLSLNSKIKKIDKKFVDHSQKLRRHLIKKEVYKNFKAETVQAIITQQHQLLKKLKQSQPMQQYNRLQFLLQNEDQVEKQIKHYFEQISVGSAFSGNQKQQ